MEFDRVIERHWAKAVGILLGTFIFFGFIEPHIGGDDSWPENPHTVMVTGPGYAETWQGAVRLTVSGESVTVDGKTRDGHGYQVVYMNAEKVTVIDATPATHFEPEAK